MKKHFGTRLELTRRGDFNRVNVPGVVDGVSMTDTNLQEDFQANKCVYGNVQLSEEENSVLTLPPKFACYETIDTVKNQAELERTFSNFRWKKHMSSKDPAIYSPEIQANNQAYYNQNVSYPV